MSAGDAIEREKRNVLAAGAQAGSQGIKDYEEQRKALRTTRREALDAQMRDQFKIAGEMPKGQLVGWQTIREAYDPRIAAMKDAQTSFQQDIARGMAATANYMDQAKAGEALAVQEMKSDFARARAGGGGGGGGGGRGGGGGGSSRSSNWSEADTRSYVVGEAARVRGQALKNLGNRLAAAAANAGQQRLNSVAENIRARNARPDSTTGAGAASQAEQIAAINRQRRIFEEANARYEAAKEWKEKYVAKQGRLGTTLVREQAKPMQEWGYAVMNELIDRGEFAPDEFIEADLTKPTTWSSTMKDQFSNQPFGPPEVAEISRLTGITPNRVAKTLDMVVEPGKDTVVKTPIGVEQTDDGGSRVISQSEIVKGEPVTMREFMERVAREAAAENQPWTKFATDFTRRMIQEGGTATDAKIALMYAYPLYLGAAGVEERAAFAAEAQGWI